MFDMMGKLSQAKQQAEETKKKLDEVYVKGTSPQNLVTVISTANGKVTDIQINDELLDDKETLTDLLVLALNNAQEKAGLLREEELKNTAKDLLPNIPGLDKLF